MKRQARHWTPDEDRQLRELWATGAAPATIALKLNRTPVAVYERASVAGLTSRPPQGFETVTAAAERVGMKWETLRPILVAAGIRIRRAQVAPWLKRGRMKIVRRVAVTKAVKAHLQLETVTRAAARSGVHVPYLLRRLHSLGIKATKRRVKLLISEEQIQAALAIGPKNTLAGRKRAA